MHERLRRRSTLYAALGFCQLPDSRAFPEVDGTEAVAVDLERNRSRHHRDGAARLRRQSPPLVGDGWTASFHSHAMLAADGIGRHRRRSRRFRSPAWRALNPTRMPTPGAR